MSNFLLEDCVPDVYQENIFEIDYERLRKRGIKLITFDLDDTIASKTQSTPAHLTMALVEKLNSMGFTVMLISNNSDEKRVERFARRLGLGEKDYIAKAEKPLGASFETCRDRYREKNNSEVTGEQMAHVGNSIVNDVAGANVCRIKGITSCLVRPVAHEKEIAPELEKNTLWHKHHIEQKGDQYYQLGEPQKW